MTATPTGIRMQSEVLRAQQIACSYLVRGCEDALTELARTLIETRFVGEGAANARAADILSDILDGWRETLVILQATAQAVPA